MGDPHPSDADAEDAKVQEEWRRLERQRLDEEIAEARSDVGTVDSIRRRPPWIVWVLFALALAAGIAVTAAVNGLLSVWR